MGFRWNDAAHGAVNGFKAGSKFGPWGMVIGTAAGGVSGGYAKDIDKKLTGNSRSGTVEGALDTAGSFGGGGGYGQGAEMATNMFTRKQDEKDAAMYGEKPENDSYNPNISFGSNLFSQDDVSTGNGMSGDRVLALLNMFKNRGYNG